MAPGRLKNDRYRQGAIRLPGWAMFLLFLRTGQCRFFHPNRIFLTTPHLPLYKGRNGGGIFVIRTNSIFDYDLMVMFVVLLRACVQVFALSALNAPLQYTTFSASGHHTPP